MILHDGTAAPSFEGFWDPSDVDYVWVAWDDDLEGSSISQSEWVLPEGWSLVSALVSQPVAAKDGTAFTAANGALLSTTATSGRFLLTNRCTFSDQRRLDRSVFVTVREL